MKKHTPPLLIFVIAINLAASSCGIFRYLPPILLTPGISKLPGGGIQEICWGLDDDRLLAVKNPIPPSFENDLVTISVEDGQIQETVEMRRDFSLPSCSPQRWNAVFTADVNEIWLMDVKQNTISLLTTGDGAVFSHDGNEVIVYTSNLSIPDLDQRGLRYLNLQGEVQRTVNVEFEDDISPQGTKYLSGLSLSPEGNYLLVSSIDFDTDPFTYSVYFVDTSTGKGYSFFPDKQTGFAHWSPDGKWLAYIRVTDDILAEGELVIADREGDCLYKPDMPAEVDALTWSPDSKRIAFLLRGAVYILDLEKYAASKEAKAGCK